MNEDLNYSEWNGLNQHFVISIALKQLSFIPVDIFFPYSASYLEMVQGKYILSSQKIMHTKKTD